MQSGSSSQGLRVPSLRATSISIGRGWYEDHVKAEPDLQDEVKNLAVELLKQKLEEIFGRIRDNPDRDNMAPKGRKLW